MSREKILKDFERALFYNELSVQKNPLEKAREAAKKLFVPSYDSGGIPAFRGLAEMYVCLTGDDELRGVPALYKVSGDLRACMDFNQESFSYVLGAGLNVYLSKAYKEFPYHEEILISEKRPARDFRVIQSSQLGYLAPLADVDPETQDYEDAEPVGDTGSEYRVGQKGLLLSITRKTIINDRVDLPRQLVNRAAGSARRAHARYAWNAFLNNATCPDGTAWFTSEHGNLGSDTLGFASVVAAITALANMTEPGASGEKLGLDLGSFNWHLVVSIGLWDSAVKLNQARVTDTNNTPNPLLHLFGEKNERIVTLPFLTDTNDWGVIRDKADVPIVEMSYLNGREEPELIQHIDERDERVFRGDKWGYKLRHEYGGTLADYRGGYKSTPA